MEFLRVHKLGLTGPPEAISNRLTRADGTTVDSRNGPEVGIAVRYDDWGVRSPRWAGIRSETVVVSGARVHVLRSDADADAPPGAPTQVLLHGMAGGGVLMLDLIRPLSAHGPVVAPDLPGSIFGQTDTPIPTAGRIEPNARFVSAFTATLGLDRVVVHGWSMGAAVALRFAADAPNRVVAAVLACPPLPMLLTRAERLGWQTVGRLALAVGPVLARGLVRLAGGRMIEAQLAYLDGKPVPSMFSGLGGDMSQFPPETMAVWREQMAEVRHHPETLGYAATAFASVVSEICVDQSKTWSAIDRVAAPVLLLWGSEDPLTTRPMIDDVLARRPDWHLHVLAGAGHGAPAEQPEKYIEAVARWLTDHVSGA